MKKLLIALSAAALLAGCATHDNNGMGGTSDTTETDSMKTDSIHTTDNGGSLHNNADNGTGSELAPNQTVTPMAK